MKAVLTFDPLSHPARAADVAAGRAIFSLQADGAEVRRVPMPSLPFDARWTKLDVFSDDPTDHAHVRRRGPCTTGY